MRLRHKASWIGICSLVACIDSLPAVEELDTSVMSVGETRRTELRFLRFDVTNFEQTLTRQDILELPRDVRERLWLLDLDLRGGPTTPRLLDNALEAIKALEPASLSAAAQNMQRLLRMTPDSAELEGTALEELLGLAPVLGLAPARVLADLLGIDVEDEILSPTVVSSAVLDLVIATHPHAQQRLGPPTSENPRGIYPVEPGTLPITLADAVSDFSPLPRRFGETFVDGVYHPGFLVGDTRARVLGDDFQITVRANANALPFKGVDLTNAGPASVNSVPSQIEEIFDFDNPGWLTIEGLIPGEPVIEEMTFRIVEDDRFHFGGRSPLPSGRGSSPAWVLAPYTLERVLLGGGRRAFSSQRAEVRYVQPGQVDPLFLATVEDGWQRIEVLGGVGAPPAPSYLWDLILEIGQVRVHDGGLAEGEGDVEFPLRDVPIGTTSDLIERTMRENLSADPNALLDIAIELSDTTRGQADFYYVRTEADVDAEQLGDWLFFIIESDIRKDDAGERVRPYAYASVGFFADSDLTERISSRIEVDGDTAHEKVKVAPGDILYVGGTGNDVYEINVVDKPSLARLRLDVTRVQ